MGSVCSTRPHEILDTKDKTTSSIQAPCRPDRVADCTIYDSVYKYYKMNQVLGDGAYGVVREAVRMKAAGDKKYAIKSIKKED